MSKIVIRRAQKQDLIQLTDIYNEAIISGKCTGDMEPYSYDEREKWLDDHIGEKYVAYVAEENEQIAGYATLSPYRKGRRALDHVAELSIYIKKEFCGAGLGTTLLKRLEQNALASGITIIVAYIFKTNTASIALFSGNGYQQWGELPGVVRQKSFVTSHVIYGKTLTGSIW